MKKIIIFAAVSLLIASQAFAVGGTGTATGTLTTATTGVSAYGGTTATCATLIGKTSTGVGLGWSTGTNGYSVSTQHKSGTRTFGTSYDSTSIFYKDTTAGAVQTAGTATDQTAFSGWVSM